MKEQHPITPSAELVQQWLSEHFGHELSLHESSALITYSEITTKAARWGADQELEACDKWLSARTGFMDAHDLRAARRPKPPSLKQQALEAWEQCWGSGFLVQKDSYADTIRRALESLPD